MPSMTAIETDAPLPIQAIGPLRRVLVFVGTILVIILLAVLPLLTPWYIHAALDAAGAPARVGLAPEQAYEMSDRSVEELVLGPGTFEFDAPDGEPFYDPSERSHLRDARTLLWSLFIIGGLSLIAVAAVYARAGGEGRRAVWQVISRAGIATVVTITLLGIASLVAFGTVFTLFHEIFFPAGNYSFDPTTQRLVQLYPFRFWQVTAAALAVLVLVLGLAAWLLGSRRARTSAQERS
jgi:integral membrane protein (TIGR01906 family)